MLSLHYLKSDAVAAKRLAAQMNIACHAIKIHQFPDGESKIQVEPSKGTAIVFASLNDPDRKLIHLAFAASALKDHGASRLVLVAPYLCYMRQDNAFHAGEAVSQRVIGTYLSIFFDRLVTVDPHLHRIDNLQDVFPDCQADSLVATGPISDVLQRDNDQGPRLLIGPDSEARQWASAIAEKLDVPFIVGQKIRFGDRSVNIELPHDAEIHGKHAIIVDDVISSGRTIIRCAKALLSEGASSVEVIVTHIVCSDAELEMILNAGVSRVRSSDSVQHITNAIHLAPLLADALKKEL